MAATITVTSRSYNSFTVSFSGFAANYSPPSESQQRKVYWYWKYGSQSDSYTTYTLHGTSSLPNNSSTTSISYTFNDMVCGATYDIFCKVEHPNNTTYWFFPNNYSGSSTGYTPGNYLETSTLTPTANVILCGMTPTSISLRLVNASKGYWYWRYKKSTDSTYSDSTPRQVSTEGGGCSEITFSNLSFGNFYNFSVAYNLYGSVQSAGGRYLIEDPINCAPSSGDPVRSFSHYTWNLMVDSIYYYRNAWSTTTGYTLTRAQTKITSSPYTLTAAKFNQLWYNFQQVQSGMSNSFPVATNSSNSGEGSEYHVFAYRFYDLSEYWCLNDGLLAISS